MGVQKIGLTPFPKGTVILSSRAPIGKVAIAGCEMYCNQGFKNLICSEAIDNRYLYWFLKGNTKYLNSIGRGATFKEISKQIVSGIEINVPDMEIQNDAVEVLEKVSGIIRHRKLELKALNDLSKARFVEMFGTVKYNPYGFPTATLKEVCYKITDGKHGGCEKETDSGYYYVGAREIYDGVIHYDAAPQITYADYAKDYRRCNIEQGDLVIVSTGATH